MPDPADIWRSAYLHPSRWETQYEPMSIPAMFDASVAVRRRAPLIDFFGRKYTYGDVANAADRFAHGLQQLGVGAGDRVGLFLPNVPHYVAAYYGAMRIGATIVNFSPLYTVDELAHQVEDSGTRILVTLTAKALLPNAMAVMDRTGLERLIVGSVEGALPRSKSLYYHWFQANQNVVRPNDPRVIPFSGLIDNDGSHVAAAIDPLSAVAMLQYTGGTTGTPKGAMLTHQNITANARQILGIDPWFGQDDRILGVIPFFHIFANMTVLHRTVLRGGEIIMLPRFDAEQVLHAIDRTRPTSLPGVPTMFRALLDHPLFARTDMSSLRVCASGGAALPAELKDAFEQQSGAIVAEGYGLTECCITASNPYAAPRKVGTIGQPLPGTMFALVNRDDPTRPPPAGEPGEIVISGPQVMKGYWNRPGDAEGSFVKGAFRTGDVGVIDEDGFIRIVDRLKDMISVGGFKVYPSQVEAVLYGHPAVREAVVIGVVDPYRGEMPKAFVSLNAGAEIDGAALKDWLNPQLGKHERVCTVEIRPDLPKTLVGKLSRKELVAEERAKVAPAA
jgi:long-chain acyl-CoA synthetase